MKNKKTIAGTVLLLLAISGFCSVINVSAFTDSIYIPPSSYAYYSLGNLNEGEGIVITEIDSDGGINVYIMNERQFDRFRDSGLISSEKMWEDIIQLSGWSIDMTEDGDYYVVLVNNALLTGKNVDVDISIYTPNPTAIRDIRPVIALIMTIGVIFGVVVLTVLLVRRSKKKKREAVAQYQEIVKPESFFCSNCGAENRNTTSGYCSKCGSKINR